MVRKILTFPDPRLREVSKPVTAFGPALKTLADDMLETMYNARGIGLAAPQIGELIRLIVIDTRPRGDGSRGGDEDDRTELEKKVTQPLILINPEIVKGEGKTTFDEGCLSIPGYYETVERFDKIVMKTHDFDGKVQLIETDGLLAICMQHELDHLEGTLFIDHLSFLKNKRIKDQIKKHGYPPPKSKTAVEDEETETVKL